MKKVLMITYYFPPLGGMPVRRTLRFLKHLPEFGWHPVVLTVRQPTLSELRAYYDPSGLVEVPEGTQVVRTAFGDVTLLARALAKFRLRQLSQYVDRILRGFPPDDCIGWLPFAVVAGKRLIRREAIDVIYTTSGPYTDHLIGLWLQRATGRPWLADFRDEWTQAVGRQPILTWQRKLDARMEQWVLRAAERVVTCTESYRALMSTLVPAKMANKFSCITNGFDREDFAGELEQSSKHRFTIVYAGFFYGAQQPWPLLAALDELVVEGKMDLDQIRVIIVGPIRERTGLEDNPIIRTVERTGMVPHVEAVRYMRSADLLWLIVGTARGRGNIPGKTFEYVATGKPILGLVPPNGEAANLLRKTRTAAAIVEPENVSMVKNVVLELYHRWKLGDLKVDPNWEEINKYEGRELTGQLCAILDQMC